MGMVPDLQAVRLPGALVELDASARIDVSLFWQQWRLCSAALDSVADAIRVHAAATLR